MSDSLPPPATDAASCAASVPSHPLIDYEPVARRARHDGWSPHTQRQFLHALAESGCVAEAARAVGMSPSSAYALRRRADARAFRMAWGVALDYAMHRLSELAFARAMHGVATPVFFQGEKIGERRRYDERLTQFLLRHLDIRFAHVRSGMHFFPSADPGKSLARALDKIDGPLPDEDDWDDDRHTAPPGSSHI